MKIDVKKLAKGKVGTTSSHQLEEEVTITDAITAPVQGQVVLTRGETSITARFDITINININMQEGEAHRQQIPLHFDREYLLTPRDDENTLQISDDVLDTNLAVIPEAKVNLPLQAFTDDHIE
ncbi:MAG: hypothetical protein PHR51_02800 [Patescibacteria group bacterium]|nr:hypothetical protein [Patescibacteria group bacterium]